MDRATGDASFDNRTDDEHLNDPRFLDVAEAIDSLLNFPIGGMTTPEQSQHQQATGNDRFVAPMVAPTDAKQVQRMSKQDKQTGCDDLPDEASKQKKNPPKTSVSAGF